MGEHWRAVRVKEAGNALVCRFDPELDRIEIMVKGRLVIIHLDDYRLPGNHRLSIDVNFDKIDGSDIE